MERVIAADELDGGAALREGDSLLLMELVCAVEDLGAHLFDDDLRAVRSLEDLYRCYVTSIAEGRIYDPQTRQPMRGHVAELRPLLSMHMEPLYALAQHPALCATWRFRATTPSPEVFNRTLWDGVLAQYVIAPLGRPEPVGLISAINGDMRSGHCELAIILEPWAQSSGYTFDALVLFLDYLFAAFPMRKVYASMLDEVAVKVSVGRDLPVREEGRLRGHEIVRGAFADLVTLAIWRDDWDSYVESRRLADRYCLWSRWGPTP